MKNRLLKACLIASFLGIFLRLVDAQVIHIPSPTSSIGITNDIQINGIGTTSTDGLTIRNLTDAAAGAQQYSPRLCWQGSGWKTNATAGPQSTRFCVEDRPVQGAAAPAHALIFSSSVAGGAFVDLFALSDSSATITLTTQGTLQVGGSALIQGTQLNLASGGVLRSNANGTKLAFPADGEVNLTDNAATNSAGLRAGTVVEVNTTTKTPTALESNEFYTNTGDGDGSTFTLLNDPPIGTTYRVGVTAAQTITIAASAGETLKYGTSTCGTSLTSNSVGSSVTFVAATGGSGAIWITTATLGSWTCNP